MWFGVLLAIPLFSGFVLWLADTFTTGGSGMMLVVAFVGITTPIAVGTWLDERINWPRSS